MKTPQPLVQTTILINNVGQAYRAISQSFNRRPIEGFDRIDHSLMDWAIDCDQDILYQQSRKKREEANRLRVVNWFISLVSFGILILLLSLSYAMIMAPTMTYFMMTLVIIILIGIFSMLVKYVSSTNRKAPEVANTDKK